jgi:hypothetical protein
VKEFDREKVYEQAKQRVEERIGFFWHLIIYIVINAVLVGIWYFSSGSGSYFWPKWCLFGWGIGLSFHFVTIFLGDGLFRRYRERKIDEFIEKEKRRFDA